MISPKTSRQPLAEWTLLDKTHRNVWSVRAFRDLKPGSFCLVGLPFPEVEQGEKGELEGRMVDQGGTAKGNRGNSPRVIWCRFPLFHHPVFLQRRVFPRGSLCSTCSPSDERFPSWFPLFHLQRGWPSEIENFSRVSSERAYAERPPPQAHMRRLNGTALEIRIRLPLRTSCACKGIHEQRAWRLQAVSAIQPYLGRTSRRKKGQQVQNHGGPP